MEVKAVKHYIWTYEFTKQSYKYSVKFYGNANC